MGVSFLNYASVCGQQFWGWGTSWGNRLSWKVACGCARARKLGVEALAGRGLTHGWLWNGVSVIITLQDKSLGSCVRLTYCNIKSILSQFIFVSECQAETVQVVASWGNENSICFINRVNGLFRTKLQIRNKLFFPYWLRLKTAPNCNRKELGLM